LGQTAGNSGSRKMVLSYSGFMSFDSLLNRKK